MFERIQLTEQHFLLTLAILVGLVGGFVSVLFGGLLRAISFSIAAASDVLPGQAYLLPVSPALGGDGRPCPDGYSLHRGSPRGVLFA